MNNKNSILKYSLANGLLTCFYVILVALLISNAQYIFGKGPDSALIPMAMLLLFVFSAMLCSLLVLGRPIMWYLDGQKKEALVLLGYTTLTLFVVMIFVFVVLYFVNFM